MPTLKVNNINIYYETQGDGDTLVLIPGLSNDISEYKGVIAGLSSRYKVVAADNRGAGRTDKPEIPYSIEMMSDDTAGLLTALGISSVHVLGVSLGGRIAADLTLRHPEHVRSLILVSTVVKRQGQRNWSNRLLNVALRVPIWRGTGSRYAQPYYALARQREAARNYDCMDLLPEIQVPTLILHGREDRIAPYSVAEEMHAPIKGSQMITVDGGHLFLFFHPRQFVGAILEFLAGVS